MKIILLGCVLAAAGCDSVSPIATVETVAPDRLVLADDSLDDLVITVRYDDGDGDLGGGVARIVDCRGADLQTDLPLPAIAPEPVVEEGRHITGTLELHVNDIGDVTPGVAPSRCHELGIDEVSPGTAVFCVVLEDAAGHEGEGDCTQAIALTAE